MFKRISMLLLSIIIGLNTGSALFAMETDKPSKQEQTEQNTSNTQEPGEQSQPNSATKKKRKKKKKKKKKAAGQTQTMQKNNPSKTEEPQPQDHRPGLSLLEEINQEQDPLSKIFKLQLFASFLYMHQQMFEVLCKIKTLFPIINSQKRHLHLPNGEYIFGISYTGNITEAGDITEHDETLSVSQKKYLKIDGKWYLLADSPESISAVLQLINLFNKDNWENDYKLVEEILSYEPYLDQLLLKNKKNINLKSVLYFAKGTLYKAHFKKVAASIPKPIDVWIDAQDTGKPYIDVLKEYLQKWITEDDKAASMLFPSAPSTINSTFIDKMLNEIDTFTPMCDKMAELIRNIESNSFLDKNGSALLCQNTQTCINTCHASAEKYKELYKEVYKTISRTKLHSFKNVDPEILSFFSSKLSFVIPTIPLFFSKIFGRKVNPSEKLNCSSDSQPIKLPLSLSYTKEGEPVYRQTPSKPQLSNYTTADLRDFMHELEADNDIPHNRTLLSFIRNLIPSQESFAFITKHQELLEYQYYCQENQLNDNQAALYLNLAWYITRKTNTSIPDQVCNELFAFVTSKDETVLDETNEETLHQLTQEFQEKHNITFDFSNKKTKNKKSHQGPQTRPLKNSLLTFINEHPELLKNAKKASVTRNLIGTNNQEDTTDTSTSQVPQKKTLKEEKEDSPLLDTQHTVSKNHAQKARQNNKQQVEQKVQKVTLPSEYTYDRRIRVWFDDDYASKHDDDSVLYHTFSPLADKYIFSLGIKTQWENQTNRGQKDTNYSLGGSIQYDSGKNKLVVFTCCKDPQGVCYHRGFDIKKNHSLLEEYSANHHWDVFHRDNFPPLGEEKKNAAFKPKSYEESYIEQDDELCVKIRDNRLGVNLVLYKPHIAS